MFGCTIAGVPCRVAYRDSATMRYYRDYDAHPIADGDRGRADRCLVAPYDAAMVDHMKACMPGADAAFAEWQAAYATVSRAMLWFDRLTFHGACIEYGGKAYIFTATSGTGKSTHIRLWRRYLGPDVKVVNGDKPIIDLHDVDDVAACGSPWSGKERWQRNVRVPLGGIAILRRAEPSAAHADGVGRATSRNTIRRATAAETVDDLINRIYLTDDPGEAAKATELLDRLVAHVPVTVLTCDMSEDAVRTSFEGLTGLPYPGPVA